MLTPERKQLIHSIAPMYRALYYGQKVFTSRFQQERFYEPITRIEGNRIDECSKGTIDSYTGGYLSLRSVKDLTEDEIAVVMRLQQVDISYRDKSFETTENELSFKYEYEGRWFDYFLDWKSMFWDTCDYLRSVGIALPYYTATTGLITVEEFIEAGTLQLQK